MLVPIRVCTLLNDGLKHLEREEKKNKNPTTKLVYTRMFTCTRHCICIRVHGCNSAKMGKGYNYNTLQRENEICIFLDTYNTYINNINFFFSTRRNEFYCTYFFFFVRLALCDNMSRLVYVSTEKLKKKNRKFACFTSLILRLSCLHIFACMTFTFIRHSNCALIISINLLVL